MLKRAIQDVCWWVLPEWNDILLGPEGLPLDRWLHRGNARVVKKTSRRTVYRVELEKRTVFVKHERSGGMMRGLALRLRGSTARREFRKASEVLRRGLRTVCPVAWGEKIRGGLVRESYLVTEAVPEAMSLDRYVSEGIGRLPKPARPAARRRLIGALARFVAALHEGGVHHNDFHAGNMLVHPEPSGVGPREAPSVTLLDLPGVRLGGPLGWRASREGLVVLCAEWWDRTNWRERFQFWRIYRDSRSRLRAPGTRRILRLFARRARGYSLRVNRGRDKRALRTNRDFVALREAEGRAHGVRDVPEPVLRRLLHDPEALLRHHLDRPVKLSPTTLLVEAVLPLTSGPVKVAYKRCRPRGAWKAFCDWFRPNRAHRGWWFGHVLLSRGIATCRPLAMCRPSSSHDGYLATEWLEGAENLHLWARSLSDLPADERMRRAARCAESLGRLLGRMHAWRITHRDLKASNLLIRERPDSVETFVIDADAARLRRWLFRRRRAADLARLATSIEAHPWIGLTLRYRFLRAYLAQFPIEPENTKRLWRRVARRTRRLIRRKRRRGREVL